MAVILKTTFLNSFSSNKIAVFFIRISLNFVPIDNIAVLVQIMACSWPGDNQLSAPMLASFTDVFGLNEISYFVNI